MRGDPSVDGPGDEVVVGGGVGGGSGRGGGGGDGRGRRRGKHDVEVKVERRKERIDGSKFEKKNAPSLSRLLSLVLSSEIPRTPEVILDSKISCV